MITLSYLLTNFSGRYYTGIGSRETPTDVIGKMGSIACVLSDKYILRSGGAKGADFAFEFGGDAGTVLGSANKPDIYLPWPKFNDNPSSLNTVCDEALKIASQFHPAWDSLKESARLLHGRNVYQVLGKDLKTPSNFVLCWTKDGANGTSIKTSKNTGGTGTAIRIAAHYGIKVYNMQQTDIVYDLDK